MGEGQRWQWDRTTIRRLRAPAVQYYADFKKRWISEGILGKKKSGFAVCEKLHARLRGCTGKGISEIQKVHNEGGHHRPDGIRRWDFRKKHKMMDDMAGTRVYLWYKWSSLESRKLRQTRERSETKTKNNGVFLWLIISGFQVFIALPVYSATSQKVDHSSITCYFLSLHFSLHRSV